MKKENRTLYKKQDRTGRKIGWILLVVLLAMSGCASDKKNRADGLTEVEFSTENGGKASEKENDRISEEEAADADGRNSSKGVSDSGQPESDGMSQNEIRVYICGQICNPGVYTLEEDSRICDVIQKAGGLKQEASETYLNQAQRLEDGMKIYVPSKEEAKTLGDPAQELSGISGQVTGGAGDSTENGVLTNAVGASVKANKFYSTFREIAQGFFECLVGPIMGNRIVLLVPYRNSRESYEERVEVVTRTRNMVHKLESRIDSKFRCGIGRVKEMGSTMKESFKEAMIALRESTSHVIHIEDVPAAQKYDGEYPRDLERRYEKRVMDKDVAGALSCAEEFIRWMEKQPGVDLEDMRIKILELVMGVEKKAFFAGTVKYAISCRRNYIHEIQEYTDIEGMKKWFLGKTSEICSNMESAREKEAVSIIEKAKSYIRDNYKKDISLDEVSREVDISPYYFSKLFKQETGGNFIEYLTEVRLRNARELLKDSGLSIKEICAESGYSDPNYFSRIFKKYEGVTPSEFRERLR